MVSSRAVATGAGYHNSGYLYPCMRSGRRVEQGKEASGPSAGGGQAAAGVDLDSPLALLFDVAARVEHASDQPSTGQSGQGRAVSDLVHRIRGFP